MNRGDKVFFIITNNKKTEKIPAIFISSDSDDKNYAIIEINGRKTRALKSALEYADVTKKQETNKTQENKENKETQIERKCKKCKRQKPLEDFTNATPTLKRYICKVCYNKRTAENKRKRDLLKKLGQKDQNQPTQAISINKTISVPTDIVQHENLLMIDIVSDVAKYIIKITPDLDKQITILNAVKTILLLGRKNGHTCEEPCS